VDRRGVVVRSDHGQRLPGSVLLLEGPQGDAFRRGRLGARVDGTFRQVRELPDVLVAERCIAAAGFTCTTPALPEVRNVV